MTQLLDLDDPACLRPGLAGAKAARLAAGRRAGLPVLPGVVVPAAVAAPALAAGSRAMQERGSGGARLTVTAHDLDPQMVLELGAAVAQLGPPVIVRSSADIEVGGRWSGAFGSLSDIGPTEVGKALVACWSSVFRPDTLLRLTSESIAPDEVRLGVVVQPQLVPMAGGTARQRADGTVDIAATDGSLAALLSGWESGVRARVAPDGAVIGGPVGGGVGSDVIAAAADLARAVTERLGDTAVEWAWTGDRIVLLQSNPATVTLETTNGDAANVSTVPAALSDDLALQIARTVHRFGAPPAEELVLPWALAQPCQTWRGLPERPPLDPAAARTLGRELTAIAWEEAPMRAAEVAETTLRSLRGPDPGPALERIARLRPVPSGPAAELIATCSVGFVGEPILERQQRWEPFLHSVIVAHGSSSVGISAAVGIGAGTVKVLHDPHDARIVTSRAVIVSPTAVPALAPRLWTAAGLVTTAGNPGAHLFDVARSLGVPAVITADLRPWTHGAEPVPPLLAAVDGAAGTVSWILEAVPPAASTMTRRVL